MSVLDDGFRLRRLVALAVDDGKDIHLLCNMAELSPSHVSHIENGKTKTSIIAAMAIANALRTTDDSLLYDNVEVSVSAYDKDLEDLLGDCTKKERDFLLEGHQANQGNSPPEIHERKK